MNFEIIKALRENIVYDKMNFDEAYSEYKNKYSRKEFGQLWGKACNLVKNENWKKYLDRTMVSALKEFSNIVGSYYEEGFDEKTISERLNIPVQFVHGIL